MKRISSILIISIILQSCAPKVKSKLAGNPYKALDNNTEVIILGENDAPPYGSEFVGELKIGDSGFSTSCDYYSVLESAKTAARKSGANLVKITQVSEPGFVSTCYRIKARLYRSFDENLEGLIAERALKNQSRLPAEADYAMIYFYRPASFTGYLVSYKLRMDAEDIIGRMGDGERLEYKVTTFGKHKFWGKTESEASVIIEVEKGKEYFVRCGVKMGAAVGRPVMHVIENFTGIEEYQKMR